MTEAEARKILINKSLTGAFSNKECDALNVLFTELEELQKYRTLDKTKFTDGYNKAINEFAERLKEKLDNMVQSDCGGMYDMSYERAYNNALFEIDDVINEIAEEMEAGDKNE